MITIWFNLIWMDALLVDRFHQQTKRGTVPKKIKTLFLVSFAKMLIIFRFVWIRWFVLHDSVARSIFEKVIASYLVIEHNGSNFVNSLLTLLLSQRQLLSDFVRVLKPKKRSNHQNEQKELNLRKLHQNLPLTVFWILFGGQFVMMNHLKEIIRWELFFSLFNICFFSSTDLSYAYLVLTGEIMNFFMKIIDTREHRLMLLVCIISCCWQSRIAATLTMTSSGNVHERARLVPRALLSTSAANILIFGLESCLSIVLH